MEGFYSSLHEQQQYKQEEDEKGTENMEVGETKGEQMVFNCNVMYLH